MHLLSRIKHECRDIHAHARRHLERRHVAYLVAYLTSTYPRHLLENFAKIIKNCSEYLKFRSKSQDKSDSQLTRR